MSTENSIWEFTIGRVVKSRYENNVGHVLSGFKFAEWNPNIVLVKIRWASGETTFEEPRRLLIRDE